MNDIQDLQELEALWPSLSREERLEIFLGLSPELAEPFFDMRSALGHAQLLEGMNESQRRLWFQILAPDDMVDALQNMEEPLRTHFLGILDEKTRHEVLGLMAYVEDEAGGLMSPRFARVRPEMSVDEALAYIRRQAKAKLQPETIYYVYVLDTDQRLKGVISIRELFAASPEQKVQDVMRRDYLHVMPDVDQEEVARLFANNALLAIPVIDEHGAMQGIVTIDDIVDVVQQEATEDAHKIGGLDALDRPYWQMSYWQMVMKRAGWLVILFIGELFTASAMAVYEAELEKAVVLSLFIPLVISSGGNSGSQASTLIIRAMALGEVRLRDWWRTLWRELSVGLALGLILSLIGFLRIYIWGVWLDSYGEFYAYIALAVGLSLIAIVTWGTLAGSMLPFILRRVGLDPASASAPFVATLVDVSGLIIYFSVAAMVLTGTVL